MRAFIAIMTVAVSWMAATLPAVAADVAPVAIKGYDPVAYFTAGKPTPGRPDIELVWDERRYRFASEENRARFKADPVRYAPQFSDYCAMALSKGELVEANPENWTIVDGKLYIFGKPVGAELFRQDVVANQAKAEGNRKLLPPR
ncbi:MAG TPA: YHS domain-containing (seleno)protein [Usitatibacter sp.]|nr:YHS domain-containing (seleno)protein [Usitatibacter sp.]